MQKATLFFRTCFSAYCFPPSSLLPSSSQGSASRCCCGARANSSAPAPMPTLHRSTLPIASVDATPLVLIPASVGMGNIGKPEEPEMSAIAKGVGRLPLDRSIAQNLEHGLVALLFGEEFGDVVSLLVLVDDDVFWGRDETMLNAPIAANALLVGSRVKKS